MWDFGCVVGMNSMFVVVGYCWKMNGIKLMIIVGIIGNLILIDGFIVDDKFDVKGIKGEWEFFII